MRQIVACWMMFSMLLTFTPTRVAQADPPPFQLPQGFELVTGDAVPDYSGGGLYIKNIADGTIIHWTGGFNIGAWTFADFQMLTAGQNCLNRDVTGNMSQIYGRLTSNGGVWIINPAGIVFGKSATINVSQLVASSLDVTNEDFLNTDGTPGEYMFKHYTEINPEIWHAEYSPQALWGYEVGDVVFKAYKYGSCMQPDFIPDSIYLIGKNVYNYGALKANKCVVMAAGDSVYLSEQPGSPVVVEAYMPEGWEGSGHVVGNDGWGINVDESLDADGEGTAQVILAAGDIWSTSLIKAYSDGGSDAVAAVDIAGAGDVTIKNDITAEAISNGVDNASATIDVIAGEDLTIESGKNFMGFPNGEETELLAHASDGKNNTAEVSLTAGGEFTIDAPDQVTVKAEAEAGEAESLLNQANVDITAGSVSIKATDYGITDEPAMIKAYAHDAVENRAGVDIEATDGDVEIIGAGSNGDSALVLALAKNGSENYADVSIKAAGDVDIIAKEGQPTGGDDTTKALVLAKAEDAELLNDASVDITAGGDVHIKSEGGAINLHGWYKEKVACYFCPGGWKWSYMKYGWYGDGDNYLSLSVDDTRFTPYVAKVLAIAETAGASNTAAVDITAGGDVVILSKDGGKAEVISYAGNALDSQNTATINLTAEDGYVMVHAIGGTEMPEDDFIASEALVEATAENAFNEESSGTNNADITIVAKDVPEEEPSCGDYKDGDVMVVAVDGGKAEVEAKAMYGDENSAGVNVLADGDVKVIALCEGQPSQAEITALAKNGIKNTAGIGINAEGDLEVLAKYGGKAEIEAKAKNQGSLEHFISVEEDESLVIDGFVNTATVDITAANVEVKAEKGGESSIGAQASNEIGIGGFYSPALVATTETEGTEITVKNVTNTATVDITATGTEVTEMQLVEGGDTKETEDDVYAEVTYIEGGDVKVTAEKGGEAGINAEAFNEVYYEKVLSSDVEIQPYFEICIEGPVQNAAAISIDAVDDVEVSAEKGGEAAISAEAWNDVDIEFADESIVTNNADIAIDAGDDVKVEAEKGGEAKIMAKAEKGNVNTANVSLGGPGHKIGGDVEVTAECGGEAEIKAKAEKGNTNTANVLICTEGELKLMGTNGGDAEVEAKAQKGNTNTASVGIGAVEGIKVIAMGYQSDASIAAKAEKGYSNDAEVIACTGGDLLVMAFNGGEAEIASEATKGYITNAYTAACATGDIIVAAADCGQGGKRGYMCGTSAEIKAEADSKGGEYDEQSTANAEVHVVSKEGGVVVAALGSCQSPEVNAGITSKAKGAAFNSAYTGVAAGADISPASTLDIEDVDWESFELTDLSDLLAGDVLVKAFGNAKAKISSLAVGGIENDAMTVVCAPGKVVAAGVYGGKAKIFSGAFNGEENTATTKVYAGDGEIGTDISDDIILLGDGASIKAVTPQGFSGYCIEDGKVVFYEDGEGATTVIGNYGSRTDCPDCPPCPCEEQVPGTAPVAAAVIAPVAPLPVYNIPQLRGCPELTLAAAAELGIPSETLQIGIGASLAHNSTLQPCQACATLVNAASILKDRDGSRMAAMLQVFNAMAPADAPFTPEMATSIAMAFEDAAEGSQYASAMEYIDAFVEYAAALDALGSPVGDSTAFVMDKYGSGLGDNANMASFVAARMEGGETF